VNDKATIYEVARMSGFSTATVSRVMHNGTGFSQATRGTVLEAAAQLGWVPNHSARSLARRRSGIVGLLFSDFASDDSALESESPLYVDQVIRGAERAATLAGDAVLIAATHSAAGTDLAWSVAGKVDGLVVLAGSLGGKELAEIARSVPVVVLAAKSTRPRLDVVGADNRGGMRELTRHLVSHHAYRDLAFVAGPARSSDSNERFAGYREALEEAGLPTPKTPDAHGGFTEAGGARAMQHLLDRRSVAPRAVVLGNDEMAIGALSVLRAAGLRVPADVAVTGFDDITSARHVRPALSTVRQPMRESGETAVHLLLDRLRDPERPRSTRVLPTEVVLRTSCGCRSSRPHAIQTQPGGST
jgi:LacI family transcriptional regulator